MKTQPPPDIVPAPAEALRREAILTVLAGISAELMNAEDWAASLRHTLARLGQAIDASRAYLFLNHTDAGGRKVTSQRYEWVAGGVHPEIDNPQWQNVCLEDSGFRRWVEELAQGQVICSLVHEFPPAERQLLESQGILSVLAAPFFAEDEWKGFIGFDECRVERVWLPAEKEAVQMAATLIGAALRRQWVEAERQRAEAAVRVAEERFRQVAASAEEWIWETDWEGLYTYCSPAVENILGFTPEEIVGKRHFYDFFVPESREELKATALAAMARKETFRHFVNFSIHKDGRRVVLETSGRPVLDAAGTLTGYRGLDVDVTARWQAVARERGRRRVLEMVAAKESLPKILAFVATLVEQEDTGLLCSILILDETGQHLLHGAAPRLPEFYNQAIHGLAIGDGVGSCGTAAATGRQVIVEDVTTHPYWEPYRELAQRAGIRACWSGPILSATDAILGTFAFYHRRPCAPDEPDLQRMRFAAELAGLAIAYSRTEEDLRRHRDHLEELIRKRTDALAQANRDLNARTTELEEFNLAMLARETRVIELKEEVNRLCVEQGRPPAYPPIWAAPS